MRIGQPQFSFQTPYGTKAAVWLPERCEHCGFSTSLALVEVVSMQLSLPDWSDRLMLITDLDICFRCDSKECSRLFLAFYVRAKSTEDTDPNTWRLYKVAPRYFRELKFDEGIAQISPSFVSIYNQSLKTEAEELSDVAGPGFRKSFEFLVKDYLCHHARNDPEREQIRRDQLGLCATRLPEPVKVFAERAVWLGNDETHYLRKWQSKDIAVLKELIGLTVQGLSSELKSAHFASTMPK